MNYSIVLLDSLFSGIVNLHQYKFTFDCKWYNNNKMPNYYDCYTNAVVNIIKKYNLEDNVYIESPVDDVLRLLKNKNPKELYEQLNFATGVRHDICMLYTFRCAVYFAYTKNPQPANSSGGIGKVNLQRMRTRQVDVLPDVSNC